MDRTRDSGSFDDGSNPSRGTSDIIQTHGGVAQRLRRALGKRMGAIPRRFESCLLRMDERKSKLPKEVLELAKKFDQKREAGKNVSLTVDGINLGVGIYLVTSSDLDVGKYEHQVIFEKKD
jgi:hypothetical protein